MKISTLLKYFFYVILGVFFIDGLTRLCFTPIFEHLPSDTKASATYKFMSAHDSAKVIILGASAANHHYIPQLFEDSLGVSCYNYGCNGRSVYYQYLSLLKAIDNANVDIAILDFGTILLRDSWAKERISDLYPFYWMNDTVRNIINEIKGDYIQLLMYSALFQYNSQYLSLIAPIHSYKGFVPLPYTGHPVKAEEMKEKKEGKGNDPISQSALIYLSRIIRLCRDKQIRLIMCISPNVYYSSKDSAYTDSLCKKENIEFWNMSGFIKDPLLFHDVDHLNSNGAEVYTNEIIRKLKERK